MDLKALKSVDEIRVWRPLFFVNPIGLRGHACIENL